MEKKDQVENLKQMIESCFTYGNLDKENKFIKPYKECLGDNLFNEIYDTYSDYLINNFVIEQNVYTDGEGLTYNSLIKITNN